MTPGVKSLRAALQACAQAKAAVKVARALKVQDVRRLLLEWRLWARIDQLPPDGDWRAWLLIGGRGSGKTRSGAEWVRALATHAWDDDTTPRRIALVAPTFDEARLVMIEGQSGLLAVHGDEERPEFEPSKRLVTWANGSAGAGVFGRRAGRFARPAV